MKRDMDLVREILLAIEEHSSGFAPSKLEIEGYSDEEVGYHIYIMIEAGLLTGIETTEFAGSSLKAVANHMTWQGHEFLDASRDPTRWGRAKALAGKVGGVTMNVLGQILTKVMMDQVAKINL